MVGFRELTRAGAVRRSVGSRDKARGIVSVNHEAPTFGVVILNWNNAHDTIPCLESLIAADPRPQHAVVVDNGSTDASVATIRTWGLERGLTGGTAAESWLVVIEAGTNRGFAGGNNLGIRFLLDGSVVSHVMLLNNDATVSPGFFADITAGLRAVPNAGLITGTILEDPARDKVWFAGGTEHPMRALYQHRLEVPQSAQPVTTDFVTGCAMVISWPLLGSIGLLAECYFPLYWEDGEYSFRARQAGFPVLYAPRAIAYHKVGATVGAANVSPTTAHWGSPKRQRIFPRSWTCTCRGKGSSTTWFWSRSRSATRATREK